MNSSRFHWRTLFRRIRPGWWLDVACLVGFAALTVALSVGWFLNLDLAVRDFVDAHRPAWFDTLLLVVNFLGSGGYLSELCLVIALWRILGPRGAQPRAARGLRSWRTWWPVYPIALAYVLTFFTIGPIKVLIHRPAPHAPDTTGAFFDTAEHISYPSGHAVNALVWYAVLVIVAAPWLNTRWRRLLRIAPPIIVTFTTVYLGFHWLTDTVAGLLLGLPLARLIDRVNWPLLDKTSKERKI